MTAKQWKSKIKKLTTIAGTYNKAFEPVINSLAEILEEKDNVYSQYIEEGQKPVIEKTSDRGSVNGAKNPLLTLWEELNRDALAYWKELGLTASALKKINDKAIKTEVKLSALEEALTKLA